MKYLEPHGVVVVPLGEDGQPRGVAFWCEESRETANLIREQGGVAKTWSLLMYREVQPKKD